MAAKRAVEKKSAEKKAPEKKALEKKAPKAGAAAKPARKVEPRSSSKKPPAPEKGKTPDEEQEQVMAFIDLCDAASSDVDRQVTVDFYHAIEEACRDRRHQILIEMEQAAEPEAEET
jgi:hypothetical protein